MASTYRDRTSEFVSLSRKLQKVNVNKPQTKNDEISNLLPNQDRSEFNKKASSIASCIQQTFQKIDRLSKLTKRSSMFNDPSKEIQELTAIVKTDISSLNVAVSDLQTLQNIEVANGNYSEDKVVHSTAICDDLKNRLMGATKQFQEVLTSRTKNMKAHESRKQIFSTNISREKPLRQAPNTLSEPPPWSSSTENSGQGLQSSDSQNGFQAGGQLRVNHPS
ncbi:hypothetical protein Leryth_021077 [Lithospermum erythrorhizon]|nr:hypothetical protein Leryth_021077 [Lithospermum erythrorhizon]